MFILATFAVTAVAGLAVTAVGAGVAAYGAAKNAKAIGKANNTNAGNEEDLFTRQTGNLDDLIKSKNRKLHNLGNIFDRFESTGAFGDTNTLKNLRTAQNDFAQLAAGNFNKFESQLRKSMGDALVNTVGSGSPTGSYAQLAADTQMQYRQQGVQTAVGISEYLSNEANKLLGAEFGIMDQKFNSKYEMDRTRVTNVNNYRLGEAATVGQGLVAYGNAGMQIGSAITSYGMGQTTLANQKKSLDIAQQQANTMQTNAQRGQVADFVPPSYPPVNVPNGTIREPNIPEGGWDQTPTINGPGSPDQWRTPQDQYPDGVLPAKGTIPLAYSSTYGYGSSSILSSVGASVVRA